MGYRIGEIAQALGAEAEGDLDLVITHAAEPASARSDDLALAMDPKFAEGLARGNARAAVLWPGADWRGLGLLAAIFAPRARMAMAGLTRLLDVGVSIAPGIHASSVIGAGAVIGEGAAIGPFTTIGAGARIGRGARIASHVSIGDGVEIGEDALILEGVRIGARVRIGDRFHCNPGAVIGGDGFSFVTPERGGVEEVRSTLGKRAEINAQNWVRIHSLGAVRIGDDVEIGVNSCVDRGTIRDTEIGNGTKLDNLVQIGHNVQIGEDCLLCGQSGVAGSTRIGNRVVLGGRAGVSDNLLLGDDVILGAATVVLTNQPAGRVLLGYPAVKMDSQIQMNKALRRLPRLAARVAAIEEKLGTEAAVDE
jgi:UDP-3-O-[3-hydroxymyristoyl] glucosamine N-acyltransferase